MPTMAEVQERLENTLLAAGSLKAEVEHHAQMIGNARSRIEGIAAMLRAADEVLEPMAPPFEEDAELAMVRSIAEEEVRYWLRRYAASAPLMQRAHERHLEVRAKVDALQEEIRPHLDAEEARRRSSRGAVGNPPGASPSMDPGAR
jgi:hypothetical protein